MLRVVSRSGEREKRLKHRQLRYYEHVARVEHHCSNCNDLIRPGDRYSGTVYAISGNRINVLKQHIDPPCDHPFDEDDDAWDDYLQHSDAEETREKSHAA